jgi:hypothetical protein
LGIAFINPLTNHLFPFHPLHLQTH